MLIREQASRTGNEQDWGIDICREGTTYVINKIHSHSPFFFSGLPKNLVIISINGTGMNNFKDVELLKEFLNSLNFIDVEFLSLPDILPNNTVQDEVIAKEFHNPISVNLMNVPNNSLAVDVDVISNHLNNSYNPNNSNMEVIDLVSSDDEQVVRRPNNNNIVVDLTQEDDDDDHNIIGRSYLTSDSDDEEDVYSDEFSSSSPSVSPLYSYPKTPIAVVATSSTATTTSTSAAIKEVRIKAEPLKFGEADCDEVQEVLPPSKQSEAPTPSPLMAPNRPVAPSSGGNDSDEEIQFVGGNAALASDFPHQR